MLSGISSVQLLIVLVIVLAIFGTKRFAQAGGDFGAMIRGIKDGFRDDDNEDPSIEDIASEVGSAKRSVERAAKELTRSE